MINLDKFIFQALAVLHVCQRRQVFISRNLSSERRKPIVGAAQNGAIQRKVNNVWHIM